MSTYDETRERIKDLASHQIRHRMRCEEGQPIQDDETTRRTLERVRAYRDELSEREKPEPQSYQSDDKPIEYFIAMKYKQLFDSARRRGKEFDLTFKDIRRLLERKTCAYTGVKLVSTSGHAHSRTIDRMDPRKGYVKGNVFAVSHRANHLKNTLFELEGGDHRMPMTEVSKMCATLTKMGFVERDA